MGKRKPAAPAAPLEARAAALAPEAQQEAAINDLLRELALLGGQVQVPRLIQEAKATAIARALVKKGLLSQQEIDSDLRDVVQEVLLGFLDAAKAAKGPKLLVPNGLPRVDKPV